jgi:hypothetical protein
LIGTARETIPQLRWDCQHAHVHRVRYSKRVDTLELSRRSPCSWYRVHRQLEGTSRHNRHAWTHDAVPRRVSDRPVHRPGATSAPTLLRLQPADQLLEVLQRHHALLPSGWVPQ